MTDVTSWSETAASNNSASPAGFPENMPFSGVNDSAREVMGAVKRFWGRIQGAYASTGSANAYVLTPATALAAYVTGERYSFRANFANTGAATLNVSALGAKAIKKMTSTGKADLAAGDIQSGQPVTVEYDGTDMVLTTPAANDVGLRGYLGGLTLANNAVDAANDVDIAAGLAVDDGNAIAMKLAATLTKQLDAAWAVGSGSGGLDTGAKANSTWYHVFVIRRADTGVVDALFSTSATAPTMPTSYTQKRRIGSVITDGSGNIRAFKQHGDRFRWVTSIADVNQTASGTSAVTRTLTVPTGVIVFPDVLVSLATGATAGGAIYLSSLDETDVAANTVNNQIYGAAATTNYGSAPVSGGLHTNTSAQIRSRDAVADQSTIIQTLGWEDNRGRFS